MKLSISHDTTYAYEGEVSRSTQYIRLTPHSSERQTVFQWTLDLPVDASQLHDAYGNIVHVMTIDHPHDAIAIRARGVVEILPDADEGSDGINPLFFLRETPLTRADESIRDYAALHMQGAARRGLEHLMADLLLRMPYTPGSTHVYETAAESFAKGAGVCQDHTHVFIACCRSQGIPARYVSGYLHTDDDEHLASHAWAEAWVDDHWHTFDVTNGLLVPSHHLKLAIGLDYMEACPVRGVRWGGDNEHLSAQAAVSLAEYPLFTDQ
ncbi:MAG: transglutaminase family protein [Gammaproteobacteria bacterium]|nr:MAG: transglutaminase family protein [Gammaproteobacteria bacterium]